MDGSGEEVAPFVRGQKLSGGTMLSYVHIFEIALGVTIAQGFMLPMLRVIVKLVEGK